MNYKDYFNRLEQEDPEFREAWKNLQVKSALAMAMVGYRIKHNFSQSELARRVGTQQANISQIESALANPTLDLVQRILRVLDLEAHFLPPTESVRYEQESPITPGLEAVDWPLQKTPAHQIAEPRKKKK